MKLFGKKPTAVPAHLFFVIYFSEGWVRAGLWQVKDGRLTVLHMSQQHAWVEERECIEAADLALQELGAESEQVRETLFALEPTWATLQGILPEKKLLFRQLTKELSLEAVGFVVIPEAIVQDLLMRYGAAHQAVVIEVLSDRVSLTQLKQGKLGQQEMIGRSDLLSADILEGFSRVHDHPLPAVVYIYSPLLTLEEIEECREQLLALDLVEQYHFLQQPQIQSIDDDEMIDVIVRTGGHAVAESKQLLPAGSTYAEATKTFFEQQTSSGREMNVPSAEDIIRTGLFDDSVSREESRATRSGHSAPDGSPSLIERAASIPLVGVPIGVMIGLALLTALFVFAAPSVIRAVVDVQLRSERVSQDLSLRLDPLAPVSDPARGVMKATRVTQVASAQGSIATTGKKAVGEKAKGKVTIFNRTSGSKTFPAGTVLQSGTLKFLLANDVTVASASTGANFESNPGKADVDVIAAAIGPESNLAENVDLTVDAFAKDTYVARTVGPFAGGSTRDVRVVSKKDADDLLTTLRTEATATALEQLKQQGGSGMYLFPTGVAKVTNTQYSDEVGAESETLSLDLTLEAEALSYSSAELQLLATQVLSTALPQGFTLPMTGVDVLTQPATSSGTATTSGQISLTAQISAVAKPAVIVDEWKPQLVGISEPAAQSWLRSHPDVVRAEITRSPALFARFLPTMPQKTQHVEILVR